MSHYLFHHRKSQLSYCLREWREHKIRPEQQKKWRIAACSHFCLDFTILSDSLWQRIDYECSVCQSSTGNCATKSLLQSFDLLDSCACQHAIESYQLSESSRYDLNTWAVVIEVFLSMSVCSKIHIYRMARPSNEWWIKSKRYLLPKYFSQSKKSFKSERMLRLVDFIVAPAAACVPEDDWVGYIDETGKCVSQYLLEEHHYRTHSKVLHGLRNEWKRTKHHDLCIDSLFLFCSRDYWFFQFEFLLFRNSSIIPIRLILLFRLSLYFIVSQQHQPYVLSTSKATRYTIDIIK